MGREAQGAGRRPDLMSRAARLGFVAVLGVASCSVPVPREAVIDITNSRDEAVIVRIEPEIVGVRPFRGGRDTGIGNGVIVDAGERRSALRTVSEVWTITVNGAAAVRSSDPDVDDRRARARVVVNRTPLFVEVIPAQDGNDP